METKDSGKWLSRTVIAILIGLTLTLFTALFSAQVKRLDDHEKRIRDMETVIAKTSVNVELILEEVKALRKESK